MTGREFDNDTILLINAFENITGTEVRDCVNSELLYFLVAPGKAAIAIGKGGEHVQTAEKMLKKQIKVLEWHEDAREFVKNLIPQADKIQINGEAAVVQVGKNKGAVIGRGGENIKVLNEFLQRNSQIKEIKVI
ncbi:MAG TPA: NusA-like transcription termination signal-binding factor [archaeon]|nr:NusA-like transcription termination signal-binding factor [archaeon]